MLNKAFFVVIVLGCLLGSGETASYSQLKVSTFNMGSGYCREELQEIYPNCDTYIQDTVNKMISIGGKYDILCLQEFPQYSRSQQKAIADKFITDFALKHKYSVFRKENSDIAILSKFAIEEKGQIDLSKHYGSQRISFIAGGKRVQVVNTHNPWWGIISDMEARKEDIRKTVRWMNLAENRGDINILAGDFNFRSNESSIRNSAIMDVKAFDTPAMPTQYCTVLDCIFVWAQKKMPFTKELITNEDHYQAIIYTKSFEGTFSYTPNRYVIIEGANSLLGVNGKVSGTSFQWAFFGTSAYFKSNPQYPNQFIVEQPVNGQGVRISCPFDGVSFLTLNNKLKTGSSWEWAFWGSWQYIQSYVKDTRFTIDSSGLTLASTGEAGAGFLVPNNPVTSWEWAFFGTATYLSSSTRYSKTIAVKDKA